MRRFGFVVASCALVSVAGTALAQAPGTPPAAPAPAANTPAQAKPTVKPVQRVTRTGTPTAGANGFFPLPIGAFAAFAGWAGATTVAVTAEKSSVSPD